MSAMPASASFPPGLAALAAKRLPNGPGGPEVDAASIDLGGADPFAVHFQRLLGKQLAMEAHANPVPDLTAAGNVPADELAALLPFFEALGLMQPTPTGRAAVATMDAMEPPAGEAAIDRSDPDLAVSITMLASNTPPDPVPSTPPGSVATIEAAIDVAATVLAAPTAITPQGSPAISAANPSTHGQAHGFAFNLQSRPAASAETADALPNAIADNDAPAKELSAGREFSTQLVAAIAAGKDTQHSPGTTAAAVQNILAQAAPGRVANQEAAPVISRPIGAPGWTEEIGNRIAWLANRSESRAELVLTPPQMGRVEVSLTVKGDQATASFASNNPVVREALEAALPRLREVLAEAGIQLGQAQVNAENARQWAQQDKHGDNSGSDHARADPAHDASSTVNSGSLSTPSGLKGGRSLVDVFA